MEIGKEEEEGEEMWCRKTRALCWQIGGDGHCCTENEMPNLLWRFPWAPLWRSAQGCDGRIRNRPAWLRHTYVFDTDPHYFQRQSVVYSIYVIQWDLSYYRFFLINLAYCGSYNKNNSLVCTISIHFSRYICFPALCEVCREPWHLYNSWRKNSSIFDFFFFSQGPVPQLILKMG